MDLSWCIICDNRIDDVMTESSLYCSASCQGRDQSYSSITGYQEHNNNNNYNNSIQQVGPLKNIVRLNKVSLNGPSPSSTTSSSRTKRPNAPSTSYPWELLYTRPRNKRHLMVKRCQPMVASSFTTATALFAPKPSIV